MRDWRNIEAAHEMERGRAVNHYDMDGHGVKAEEHLRAVEREQRESIEWAPA